MASRLVRFVYLIKRENEDSSVLEKLMLKFQKLIQHDLEILHMNQLLGDKNKDLSEYLAEIHTLRRKLEETLQIREEDLKESQRIAHVGNWRLDLADNKLVWSDELYQIYGLDPAFPPPPFSECQNFFTPESWCKLFCRFERYQKMGKLFVNAYLKHGGRMGNRGGYGYIVRQFVIKRVKLWLLRESFRI